MSRIDSSDAPGLEDMPAPKKRKIRKGTLSCWECKRRKTRCTFSAPTEVICDGCKSRQTKCVSQEFQDDVNATKSQAARLSQIESVVEQLVRRNGPAKVPKVADEVNHSPNTRNHRPASKVHVGTAKQLSPLDEVEQILRSAWPSQHDLDLILKAPVNVSVLFHGVICLPYKVFLSSQVKSPFEMLQLPTPGLHPVFTARKLLMLAAWLQGVPPSSKDLDKTELDYRVIESRAVEITNRLVTSNDDLIGSIEGIECVMIESMYQNNAGNLRRAWLINRKAMYLAQLIGLHTGHCTSNSFLDESTRDRIDPEYMWLRIVITDRYLSLILDLPQGSPENTFASSAALDRCPPLERLERLIVVAAGLTLQRNSAEQTDVAATSKIDKMLQEAAILMPPQWWVVTPDLATLKSSDAKSFDERIRLTNQVAHRHLLVQLHLPYLLRPSKNHSYEYSKMTAANASRALITQFVSFRSAIESTAYCRGFDFVTFVASTTLCLAHIEARHEKPESMLRSIRHQRLSDRGLLERTLEIMENLIDDTVAQNICSILRPLLAIEEASERGRYYRTCTISEYEPSDSQPNNDQDALQIQIPYYGTIKIEGCPSESLVDDDRSEATLSAPATGLAYNSASYEAVRSAGYEISSALPLNADWQAVPTYINPAALLALDLSAPSDQSFDVDSHDMHLLVPGLSHDVDEWALQGVDMALFNSLTGSTRER